MKRAIIEELEKAPATPSAIAQALGVVRSSASARLGELFHMGILTREPASGSRGKPEYVYGVKHG